VTPELRFRWLWKQLFGGPMFPAKPLKWGGTIHRKAVEARLAGEGIQLVLTPCPDGCKRLAWKIPGKDNAEIITNLLTARPNVFSMGDQ
jgi:hypothetical protein